MKSIKFCSNLSLQRFQTKHAGHYFSQNVGSEIDQQEFKAKPSTDIKKKPKFQIKEILFKSKDDNGRNGFPPLNKIKKKEDIQE